MAGVTIHTGLYPQRDAPEEVAVVDERLAEEEGAVVGPEHSLEDLPHQVVHQVVPGVLEEEPQHRRQHLPGLEMMRKHLEAMYGARSDQKTAKRVLEMMSRQHLGR